MKKSDTASTDHEENFSSNVEVCSKCEKGGPSLELEDDGCSESNRDSQGTYLFIVNSLSSKVIDQVHWFIMVETNCKIHHLHDTL